MYCSSAALSAAAAEHDLPAVEKAILLLSVDDRLPDKLLKGKTALMMVSQRASGAGSHDALQIVLALLAMGPNLEQQHRHGKGIFAEKPTPADATLRKMYEKLHTRCVQALLDHDWLTLAREGWEVCGACNCVPLCY